MTKKKVERKHAHKYVKGVEVHTISIGPTDIPVRVELERCKCGKLNPITWSEKVRRGNK